MLGRGLSLNRGVTGVRFSNLVLYCLGAGKWVLFQAEDEIRLCQEYWSLCLSALAAGGLLKKRGLTFHLSLALSCIDFTLTTAFIKLAAVFLLL